MDKMPTARALPPQQGSVQEDERAADAASLVLQQSLETLITSCFTMLASAVRRCPLGRGSGGLPVPGLHRPRLLWLLRLLRLFRRETR